MGFLKKMGRVAGVGLAAVVAAGLAPSGASGSVLFTGSGSNPETGNSVSGRSRSRSAAIL